MGRLLSLVGALLVVTAAQAYQLAWKDAIGVKRAYQMDMTMEETPADPGIPKTIVTMAGTFTEWATAADADGAAAVRREQSEVKVTLSIAPLKMDDKIPAVTATFTRKPNGDKSDYAETCADPKVATGIEDEYQYMMTSLGFPAGDLTAGARWQQSIFVPKTNRIEAQTTTASYRLVGARTYNGKEYLQISATASFEKKGMPGVSEIGMPGVVDLKCDIRITVLWDPAAGEVATAIVQNTATRTAKSNRNPGPGYTATAETTVTLKRIAVPEPAVPAAALAPA